MFNLSINPKCYTVKAPTTIVLPGIGVSAQLENRSRLPATIILNNDAEASFILDPGTTQIFPNGDVHLRTIEVQGTDIHLQVIAGIVNHGG